MPPPAALPACRPRRPSYRSNNFVPPEALTTPATIAGTEETSPKLNGPAVHVYQNGRWQDVAHETLDNREVGKHNNGRMDSQFSIVEADGAGADYRHPSSYHKGFRRLEASTKTLPNDPELVLPKLVHSLEAADNQTSANVLYESRQGTPQDLSQCTGKELPPSPARIDALTGMEDIARNVYHDPLGGELFEYETRNPRREPLQPYTQSNADKKQPQRTPYFDFDERLMTRATLRNKWETHPYHSQSPYRNQNGISATPVPLREKHQFLKSPYKSLSSPFFRSSGASFRPNSQSAPQCKNGGSYDIVQGFRIQPPKQRRSDSSLELPIHRLDSQGIYRVPFYRGRGPMTATSAHLVVPETPRTVDGLFQRPDVSRAIPFQPIAALNDVRHETWPRSSAPQQAALLPSATPSTADLLGSQLTRDTVGIRGARSGTSQMQSSTARTSSRPVAFGQADYSRGLHSDIRIRRSVRR